MYYLIGVVALIVFIFCWGQLKKRRITKMIEEEWNEKKILSQKEPIDSVDTYWKNKSSLPNYMGVDFITWRDLSMDEVYQKINYTQTSVGSEFLYHQLHEIQLTNQDRDESFYELIKTNREIC